MARFSYKDADNYGGQGGGGFFSLKDDGDSAVVRFLYDNVDDVEGMSVHEIQLDDKKRYVNCLREYNQPIDECPFCREGIGVQAKLFIPLYNVDDDQVQVWERGKKFFGKISNVCARYNKHPIVSQQFEVVRRGKARSTSTDYDIFRTEDEADKTRIEDFEKPNILGGLVLDKSFDDMEYFLESHEFPPTDESEYEERPSRNVGRSERTNAGRSERTGRRTPVRRSREDSF